MIFKKGEKQKLVEEDLTLPKSTLLGYTSVQIRGILSIKPEIEKAILDKWAVKKRTLNLLM